MESGPNDQAAFERAASLATSNQARLTVIEVMEPIPPFLTKLSPLLFRQARIRRVETAQKQMRNSVTGRIDMETKIPEGIVFLEIIREVLKNGQDLIVKSAEGTGTGEGALWSSTDLHLLRKCPCPVWLLKPSAPTKYQSILAAIDFDHNDGDSANESLNRQILPMAASLALSEFYELHIVHAWTAYGESSLRSGLAKIPEDKLNAYIEHERVKHQRLLDSAVAEYMAAIGRGTGNYPDPQIHLIKGHARDAIPELANTLQTDLLVMGTVARTGIQGFLMGNTAETILKRVDCSVLAVKPEGFATPVTLEEG